MTYLYNATKLELRNRHISKAKSIGLDVSLEFKRIDCSVGESFVEIFGKEKEGFGHDDKLVCDVTERSCFTLQTFYFMSEEDLEAIKKLDTVYWDSEFTNIVRHVLNSDQLLRNG